MATIAQALDRLMRCDGALAAAVVDAGGPRVLGRAGSPAFDIETAASGHASIVRNELAAIAPGGTDAIDDTIVTLGSHYHLLRPCAGRDGVFVLFVLERPVANLALARRVLREAEETFVTDPLLRLVYTSRSIEPARQADELRSITGLAREANARREVGGALLAANGHYLQLIEGPRAAVEALFETILLDPRHTEVELLKLETAAQRDFATMTFALVERNEIAGDTTERVRELRRVPQARAADFLRLFSVPRVTKVSRERQQRGPGGAHGVVFASPGGLWAASVVGHMAAVAGDRVGRTTITGIATDGDDVRALVEYADLVLPDLGAVRGVSLARPHASASPLFERVALIVLIVTASDVADALSHLHDWAALPQVQQARPMVLLASSLAAERLDELAGTLRAAIGLEVSTLAVKPHDAAAVWAATASALRAMPGAGSTGGPDFSSTIAFVPTTVATLPAVLVEDESTTAAAALEAPAPAAASRRAAGAPASDPMAALDALPGLRGASRFATQPPSLLARAGAAAEGRQLAVAHWAAAQQALAARLGTPAVEDLVLRAAGETIVCRPCADGTWLGVMLDADAAPLAAVRAVLANAADRR